MRPLLHPVMDLAQTASADELAVLLGELRTIELIAHGRMSRPAVAASRSDEWLTVQECAARMHKSRDWIYRHASAWPFTRRVGKTLLFSSMGLDSFLKKSV